MCCKLSWPEKATSPSSELYILYRRTEEIVWQNIVREFRFNFKYRDCTFPWIVALKYLNFSSMTMTTLPTTVRLVGPCYSSIFYCVLVHVCVLVRIIVILILNNIFRLMFSVSIPTGLCSPARYYTTLQIDSVIDIVALTRLLSCVSIQIRVSCNKINYNCTRRFRVSENTPVLI